MLLPIIFRALDILQWIIDIFNVFSQKNLCKNSVWTTVKTWLESIKEDRLLQKKVCETISMATHFEFDALGVVEKFTLGQKCQQTWKSVHACLYQFSMPRHSKTYLNDICHGGLRLWHHFSLLFNDGFVEIPSDKSNSFSRQIFSTWFFTPLSQGFKQI